MSYILEALRRAEAERQRGAVPGLHAQPASTALADAGLPQANTPKPWRKSVLAAVVLVTVAAGVVGWLQRAAPLPAAQQQVVPAIVPPALPVAAPAAPPLPPASSGGLGALATLPVPAVVPPKQVAPPAAAAPSQPTPASATAAARMLPPPVPAQSDIAASATLAPPALSPLARGAGPGAPAARLPTLAELPEALRRELQPLNLGGSVYAEQPAQRMVIVNGQVFHEGDRLNGELQVQEIRLKSVVFSLRGQRFEMAL